MTSPWPSQSLISLISSSTSCLETTSSPRQGRMTPVSGWLRIRSGVLTFDNAMMMIIVSFFQVSYYFQLAQQHQQSLQNNSSSSSGGQQQQSTQQQIQVMIMMMIMIVMRMIMIIMIQGQQVVQSGVQTINVGQQQSQPQVRIME